MYIRPPPPPLSHPQPKTLHTTCRKYLSNITAPEPNGALLLQAPRDLLSCLVVPRAAASASRKRCDAMRCDALPAREPRSTQQWHFLQAVGFCRPGPGRGRLPRPAAAACLPASLPVGARLCPFVPARPCLSAVPCWQARTKTACPCYLCYVFWVSPAASLPCLQGVGSSPRSCGPKHPPKHDLNLIIASSGPPPF